MVGNTIIIGGGTGLTNSDILDNVTYTIDGQSPAPFNVPFSTSNFETNLVLFNSRQLSPGQHKLVVGFNGNNANINFTVPLIFSYFVQQDSTPSNTSTSTIMIHRKPTGAIIGGVIGGLILILLLLALFFFNRRRNNRRSQALSEMSYTNVTSPFTVPSSNPTSTFPPEDHTSDGQSLQSPSISSKLTQRHQRNQPSDPSSMSSSNGITPLTPLRQQFSSPAFISPSSSPPPPAGSQANSDVTMTTVPQARTESLMQQSLSLQGANPRLLRHEDSGIRMPPSSEDDVLKLPPFYTPE